MKKNALLFAVIAACFLISVQAVSEDTAVEGEEQEAAPEKTEEPAVKTAKPILIRHGFLYSAEISRLKPEIQPEVRGDQPLFPDPVWAAVMLKLPRNRGVSRFDYELKTPSGSYPCLAVALESEPYSQKRDHWTIEAKKEQEGKFVRMLFAFPASDLTKEAALMDLELVFKMMDSICQPPPIPFRILPKDQPLNADPQTLGENGNCGLSWLEMHPELQPSLDDNPSAGSGKKEGKESENKAAAGDKAPAKPAAAAQPEKKPADGDKAPAAKPAAQPEKKPAAGDKAPAAKPAAQPEKKPAAEEKTPKK